MANQSDDQIIIDNMDVKIVLDEPLNIGDTHVTEAGVYLVESGTLSITFIDSAWENTAKFGGAGQAPGEFGSVWNITEHNDLTYVVDNAQSRVSSFQRNEDGFSYQDSYRFPSWVNAIFSVESLNDRLIFSGRESAFFEAVIEDDSSCAIFLVSQISATHYDACLLAYPAQIMAAEPGSILARNNRVFTQQGISGDLYAWFTHAPDVFNISEQSMAVKPIDLDPPFYTAPEDIHFTEITSQASLFEWQSQHYQTSRLVETGDHLILQYTSRNNDLESYTRVAIFDNNSLDMVDSFELRWGVVKLHQGAQENELLVVLHEENETIVGTLLIEDLLSG